MEGIVGVLELRGRDVVERLVNAPAIEPVDVGEPRPLDVLDGAPGSLDQCGTSDFSGVLSSRVMTSRACLRREAS